LVYTGESAAVAAVLGAVSGDCLDPFLRLYVKKIGEYTPILMESLSYWQEPLGCNLAAFLGIGLSEIAQNK